MRNVDAKWLLSCLILLAVFSCIRKNDFDMSRVKWDEITPAWGLPIINSTLSIDQAINKNKSKLIIQVDQSGDEKGFITFIYLDTVVTPNGDTLFKHFPKTFGLETGVAIGGAASSTTLVPGITIPIPDFPSLTFPIQLDSVQSLAKITFKGGTLDVKALSQLRQNLTFTLSIPQLIDPNNNSFSEVFSLKYVPGVLPTVSQQPSIDLTGYSLSAETTGLPNQLKCSITNISITGENNDNGSTLNKILPTDSISLDMNFTNVKYKLLEGQFEGLHLYGIPSGQTNIGVFDNALRGHVVFANPVLSFDFVNSYGLGATINIENASVYYAYDSVGQPLIANATNMKIPGETMINPVPISQIGQSITTPIQLDTTNSSIRNLLTGAPNQFTYDIPSISLTSASGTDAFISDDSKIQINTEVRIPLLARVDSLVLTDTANGITLFKAENVDYIEFRAGSDNSIPLQLDLQLYFFYSKDTTYNTISLKTGKDTSITKTIYSNLLDSLVDPPNLPAIVIAPGNPIYGDPENPLNITGTSVYSSYVVIPVSKEKYARIAPANRIVTKGRIISEGSASSKFTRFYTYQTCTFRLSAYAKLRIDPNNPSAITNVGQ